ncbi:MAG: uracil-DNA glycosylase family protein [Planctomycetota bacterium]
MKLKELKDLRSRIIDEVFKRQYKDVWFFPPNREMGVMGYEGTDSIMFVGLNPSYGRFPSERDGFFYEQLKENKFENAHLTDLIKIREIGKNVHKLIADDENEVFEKQLECLKEEIDIVCPKLVVAFGKQCKSLLHSNTGKLRISCDIGEVPHYSPRFKSSSKLDEFDKDFSSKMRAIKRKYDKIKRENRTPKI